MTPDRARSTYDPSRVWRVKMKWWRWVLPYRSIPCIVLSNSTKRILPNPAKQQLHLTTRSHISRPIWRGLFHGWRWTMSARSQWPNISKPIYLLKYLDQLYSSSSVVTIPVCSCWSSRILSCISFISTIRVWICCHSCSSVCGLTVQPFQASS